MPKLQITLPDGSNLDQELTDDLISVGRIVDNMIQIEDASVSSHHAQLVFGEAGDYVLQDLGSTNGTRLNGKQINEGEQHKLQNGDKVRFGSIEATYGSEGGFSPGQSITVQSTSVVAAEAIARHCAYLARMVTEGVVPHDVSAKARRVWEDARKAVPNLSVPAAVAYDGGPMHYTWDTGRFQATVEIPANGSCEWYVSDRQTGVFDGGEFDPAEGLPAPLVVGLKRITE